MTIPYTFQVKAARQLHRWSGRGLVASEMGTGKSFTSLLYAMRHPEARPIVIVCPASVKWSWQRECAVHCGWSAEVLEGTKPPLFQLGQTKHAITIINYDILHAWLDFLKAMKPQLVIGDEVQYIKEPNTRRTKTFRELCKGVPHVLALSGTPLVNRPAEMFQTLNILRPDLFPSFWKFGHRYCAPRRAPWGVEFKGASNLNELHELLLNGQNGSPGVMVRTLKEDVLKDLPAKRRIVIPLDMERRQEYDLALNQFLVWLSQQHPGKVSSAMRAERLVQLGYLKRLAAELKGTALTEWVDSFLEDSDQKLLLFAVHRKIVAMLHARYPESVYVDGSVVGNKRQKTFDQFLNSNKTRILIGNVKAAGVGWSAKGVSTVAFAELPWTPGELTQAEDRVHGIGRGAEGIRSTAYFLVARESIEEKLLKILQDKSKVLRKTLDGGGKGDKLDIYDKLCEELKKENNR